MTETAALEGRVRYLEQLSTQLGEQVKVMKQLVTTEVADLKAVMQLQVAEVKQIVMHQDRIYQERIRRLETRVEQLSEFSLQLARSSGTAGTRELPPDLYVAPVEDDATGAGASPRHEVDDTYDDEDLLPGVEGVLAKYEDKLMAVYTYYTTSNIQVFHPAMALPHFTRLMRDCDLCGFDSGTPAELLWMAVMRKLGKRRKRRQPSAKNTSVVSGKFTHGVLHSFAHERLDEIPREAFGEALNVVAVEKMGKARADLSPEALLETFLVTQVFPATDGRLEEMQTTRQLQATGAAGSDAVGEYKTPEVKAVVKEHMARLKDSFKTAIAAAQDYRDEHMNLDGFVELVRRHHLFSLISKPDVRQVFLACAAVERERNPEAPPDSLSMPSLMLAVYHLADRIYGDRLFVDKYPTPEARVRKLMAKMYILQ